MKKTLMLLLAVCMMVTMIPATAFALDEQDQEPAAIAEYEQEAPAAEDEYEDEFSYESKMRLAEGEDGWTQDPVTLQWMYYSNGVPLKGKKLVGGSYYYFDTQGYLQTGWVTIKNAKYYFDPTPGVPGDVGSTYGVMKTGWLTLKSGKYFLDEKTGKMKTGWVEDHKYYMNPKNGKMKTGWLTLDGYKYYLDPKTGKMKTGWVKIKNDKYYFDAARSGRMRTKWLEISGKKYYLNAKNGKMYTGFHKIGSYKYYFDKNKGVMKKGGLLTLSGNKYYFDNSGHMATGKTVTINKKLYYFFNSGKAVKTKGWFKGSDKKQRYGLGGGIVATGEKKIGSYWYVFNSKTGLVTSTMDRADKNMQGMTSSTKYFIMVIKRTHQVRVYTGKTGSWKRAYTWTCSVGKAGAEYETPTGVFSIKKKLLKHEVKDEDAKIKVRCWGICRFYRNEAFDKDYAINSIIYRASDGTVYDGRLGMNVSKGSVRLPYNYAMWVYNNAPVGTTVYIY